MQQTPIIRPMIMESLRRRDLIMPIKLFTPGIVPNKSQPLDKTNVQHGLHTYYLGHSVIHTCN